MIRVNKPKYINWIVKEDGIVFEDGLPLECYLIDYVKDENVYDEWALHLRRHYEDDDSLAKSLIDTEMEIGEYLRTYVIPQKEDAFGPTSRANDITEILISDLFEFILNYTVLRGKQENRSGKSQSEHGTDILALKIKNKEKPSSDDELCAIEVKAGLSSKNFTPIIDAKIDSDKYDSLRYSHTLNYFRKIYRDKSMGDLAEIVTRFQKKSEDSYKKTYVGVGVVSRKEIDGKVVAGVKGVDLKLTANNKVFLVHGKSLMDLTHEIYGRIRH